uniref:Uncharacterized protein n=1 Tax=Craspedostauros australis TaxID=1486917 RepID=A0A7R9WXN4_9STRA|mmetsp:Transcript_23719/g.66246  ORF Transcript_23719/g.66246 Transcript_23719/m.66246 type:complete len:110 (+) Transcript_23719:161-490(+)
MCRCACALTQSNIIVQNGASACQSSKVRKRPNNTRHASNVCQNQTAPHMNSRRQTTSLLLIRIRLFRGVCVPTSALLWGREGLCDTNSRECKYMEYLGCTGACRTVSKK